jgi:hypothetical protein
VRSATPHASCFMRPPRAHTRRLLRGCTVAASRARAWWFLVSHARWRPTELARGGPPRSCVAAPPELVRRWAPGAPLLCQPPVSAPLLPCQQAGLSHLGQLPSIKFRGTGATRISREYSISCGMSSPLAAS